MSERDAPVAVGPYLIVPILALAFGVAGAVFGGVVFRPLRNDAWFGGFGAGLGLASIGLVVAFLGGGSPNRRFLRRVAGALSCPGLVAWGLGAVFVVNGAFDRSPVTDHEAKVVRVRETVDIESSGVGNVLVDVEDWRNPGASLEVRFEHGEVKSDVTPGTSIHVKTRSGALGFERRVD